MNICKERQQAIEKGEKYYFTGKPCKNGHISKRSVSYNKCLECDKLLARKYKQKNKDIINKRNREIRSNNLEFFRERERKYYHENREQHCKSGLKWREQNREKAIKASKKYYYENIEHCREVRKEYSKNNRGRLNALSAKRYAQKIQATPEWADYEKILKIYQECQKLTENTEIVYNVDHIVPLLSENVCGLHCEDNLQILTKVENLKKSNKHE